MKGIGTAIGILFVAGAVGGFIYKQISTSLIVGTSIEENIFTYLVPGSLFVGAIVLAFFAIFRKKRNVISR